MKINIPEDYDCVICPALNGDDSGKSWIEPEDFFYRDDLVAGFISSKTIEGNPGHALVVPVDHYASLYDLPREVGHRIFDVSQMVARAMKEIRGCDEVNVVQNNEPAAGQHAFHYHMHVVPRFKGDNFNEEFWRAQLALPEERMEYARKLRKFFEGVR